MKKLCRIALPVAVLGLSWLAFASGDGGAIWRSGRTNPSNLEERAGRLWHGVTHVASFHDIASNRPRLCSASNPPQGLATPDPLLEASDLRITVSFVVGRDGNVYSPLILDGDSGRDGRSVLNAVRHWRFRPAVCNGAPTEFEAKVEFSSHANRF